MKTNFKLLSVCIILILAVSVFTPSPAYAANPTVVKPTMMNGWGSHNDGYPGGMTNFVAGPAGAPLGTGSLNFTLNGTARMVMGTSAYAGTRLDQISNLEFSTYRSSADVGNLLAVTLQLDIDYDLNDANTAWQGRLVFEPYFTAGSGNILEDTWYAWTPLTGLWWASGAPGNAVCPQAAPCTLESLLSVFPHAGLRAGVGVLQFKAGGPWSGFDGNIDAFTIGINGTDTTYDFEPEPLCTAICYVDAVNGNDANGGASIGDAKKTIQAAIDAVSDGGQVRVLPGNYSETATNRWVLGTNGPHQFGLFIDKDGVTIQGVTGSDVPITDYNALGAYITTNATNNFGPSGVFVQGDGVTLAGLHFGPNNSEENKTIEIIGDAFTLKDSHVDVPGGGSVYFGDWQFNTGTDTSHIKSYTIDHNLIDQSASIDFASGAGYSGDISGRRIINNEFENADSWPSISFNGSDTGVPWFVQSVGGAVIQGNTFTNTYNIPSSTAAHIRVRGTVNDSQFNWTSYWTDNTFNKAVVTLVGAYPPFDVQTYSYPGYYGTFNNVRRIGVTIQSDIDKAVAGDTVLVKDGTYIEQVVVNKSLTLLGESGADATIIKAPATIPVASNLNSTIIKIAGSGVSVDMSGFTVTGPGPSGCGSINAGIFVLDDAYANIHDNKILDIRDHPFSGCQNGVAILVGRASLSTNGTADITDNVISGYQKNGITVSNAGSSALVENNLVTGAGATSTIAQNGIQFSAGATGLVKGNTISNHSYSPGSYTSTGMLLWGANVDTFGNTLNQNQVGVYHIDGSGVHDANLLNVSTAGTESPYFYGFIVDAPPPGLNPVPFEDEMVVVAAPMSLFSVSSAPVQDVDILNNELIGDGTSAGYGIGAYGGYGALDIDLTVKNNKILNFGTGLDIYQCTGTGCTSNVFSNLDVNLNSITGNIVYGLLNTDAALVDAETNWWGNANGPQPGGSGDLVSGDADFTPWLCVGTDTSAATGFQPTGQTDCSAPTITGLSLSPSPVYLNAATTFTAVADDSTTGGSSIASAQYQLNSAGWLPMLASDGAFDEPNEVLTTNFTAATLGSNTVCVRATDSWNNTSLEYCTTFTVGYVFTGFFQPIDMNAPNLAKAGQTIPVKWRLTDANGVPISNPSSFFGLYSYSVSCTDFSGTPPDTIETYSGSSGLQYLGDGYWQFNWKTPKTYANTCRSMYVMFQGGLSSPEVDFQFKP